NEAAQKEGEEAQKREKEEQERLRRQKEQEERAQRERKAREDAERRESERQKTRQEEERIAKEREKLSVSEKKAGISQIKFLAVALLLGVVLIGYWMLAPGESNAPESSKSTPIPTPKSTATTIQTPKVTPTVSPTPIDITSSLTLVADKKSLKIGETWDVGRGYIIKVNSIDRKANPLQVWLTIFKNGNVVGDNIVASLGEEVMSPSGYRYSNAAEYSFLIIRTKIAEINIGPPDSVTLTDTYIKSTDFTNSIGMEFVSIPAGEFDMGSPLNDKDGNYYERPVHRVNIGKAFYMGKFEVTQKQWREVMGSNPSYFKGDNLPVELVSWNDVQEFIKKLNETEDGSKYRLPTEAEWEYAARAGTTTRYSFGDNESELGGYAWYNANSGSKTHEVGQKKPNPWGLYDMHGNVYEWVQDYWHGDYNGAPTDGSSWVSGGGSDRVARGCSWFYADSTCRSAIRFRPPTGFSDDNLGFRLLRIS
ncbi:MAG: SUMF1/EgtB/PvdO family nonheme iron enzyme, partial [Candidatus Methanoperedens sp.]|nr:SUMF1/EgtB/PvdO family nonheme iron enzyme [Candidatus Methanoperedens sp.]